MHISVLKKEVIEYLDPKPNENFIDGTIGQGGHATLILEKTGPAGKVLGIDLDANQTENCRNNLTGFGERLILENSSYINLKEIAAKNNFQADGILLDLGMSSRQLESGGFSFLKDEPLDMRYSQNNDLTATIIVNQWRGEEIEKTLKEYGEERFSRNIAESIIEARKKQPIKTTFDLVSVIARAIPARYQHGRIHFATRTFQALRIAVNRELDNLKNVLPQMTDILKPGARIAIISFHSLEDRIVKNFFREEAKKNTIKILTKKPITALPEEIEANPRARSAKLRAAVIL